MFSRPSEDLISIMWIKSGDIIGDIKGDIMVVSMVVISFFYNDIGIL